MSLSLGTFEVNMHVQIIAGILEPVTEASCVRYYNRNAFVSGPGAVVLTVVYCLWVVDVIPVVKIDK